MINGLEVLIGDIWGMVIPEFFPKQGPFFVYDLVINNSHPTEMVAKVIWFKSNKKGKVFFDSNNDSYFLIARSS